MTLSFLPVSGFGLSRTRRPSRGLKSQRRKNSAAPTTSTSTSTATSTPTTTVSATVTAIQPSASTPTLVSTSTTSLPLSPLPTPARSKPAFCHTPLSSTSSYEIVSPPSSSASPSPPCACPLVSGLSKKKSSKPNLFSSSSSTPTRLSKMGQANGRMEQLEGSLLSYQETSYSREQHQINQPPHPQLQQPQQAPQSQQHQQQQQQHHRPPQPDFYHAPHSAPAIPTTTPRHRSLTRALSGKRRPRVEAPEPPAPAPALPPSDVPPKALKTLGTDLKAEMKQFEALVNAAESASVSASSTPSSSSSSSPETMRRASTTKASAFFLRKPSPSPGVDFDSLTRPPLGSHRRSSASASTSSRAGSIKSARRAEREWRAKVVTMSSSFDHRSPPRSHGELRGPVPPRRTPTMARIIAQASTPTPSPLSARTSPQSPYCSVATATEERSPAKSIVSNRLFETLGHYAHLTPEVGDAEGEEQEKQRGRSRKPSVPHSAVSSFYADGYGTRPSSLAASQLLSIAHSQPSQLSLEIVPAADSYEPATPTAPASPSIAFSASPAPAPTTPYKVSLPPFESFHRSPRLVGETTLPSAEHSWVEEKRGQASASASASGRGRSVSNADIPPAIQKQDKFHSLPARLKPDHPFFILSAKQSKTDLNSCPAPPPSPATCPPRSTDAPAFQTPARSAQSGQPETPITPYSPTTAYILTAPSIEDLAWSGTFSFDLSSSPLFASSSRSRQPSAIGHEAVPPSTPHPFAASVEAGPPEPPTPPSKSPVPRRLPAIPLNGVRTLSRSQTTRNETPLDPPNSSAIGMVSSNSATSNASATLARKSLPPPLALRPRHLPIPIANATVAIPRHALQHTQHPQHKHKLDIIGSSARAPNGNGVNLRAVKGVVDLTPGMESGHRPPKSGLPTSDLERWLAGSSISA